MDRLVFWYLEKLKSFEETRNIPVLAVSANAMKDEINQTMATGFVEFNFKPIDITFFVKSINEILNNKKVR